MVDGTIPIDEVRRVTPALVAGADTLERSLARLRDVAEEPYLLGPVRDAVDAVRQRAGARAPGRRATPRPPRSSPRRSSGPTARSAGTSSWCRTRPRTGAPVGSSAPTASSPPTDGDVDVGRLLRTGVWNGTLEDSATPSTTRRSTTCKRYGQFRPQFNLQNVNLSPDFPTVGKVLETLAPEAGVGDVDGVIAVDPEGLAALLELTGPVSCRDGRSTSRPTTWST